MKLVALIRQEENPWAGAWKDSLEDRGMQVWEISGYDKTVQRDIISRRPSVCVPLVLDQDVLAKRNGGMGTRLEAALALEWAGAKMLNKVGAITSSSDKLLAASTLRRANLSHPETFALGNLQEWPFQEEWAILKPAISSSGADIHLVSSLSEARKTSRLWPSRPVLQRWIESPRCFRIIATPEKSLYCIEKRAPAGEIVAATNFGAKRIYQEPWPELEDLARDVTRAFGAGVLGVDILEKDGALYVLEANPAFAFDLDHPSVADDLAALVG